MIALLETVQPLQFYVSVVISVGCGFTEYFIAMHGLICKGYLSGT